MTDAAYLCAALASFAIFGSALWASHRFSAYDRLPRHFGPTLEPTAFGPRWLMVWGVPFGMVAILWVLLILPVLVPEQYLNGDPALGVVIASPIMMGAQVFTLFLLTRWARKQA